MTGCHPCPSSAFPVGGRGPLTALGPAALSKARRRQARSRVKPAHHPWIGRCCSSHLYKKRGAEPWPPQPRSGPIQSLPRLRSPEKGTPERESGCRASGSEVGAGALPLSQRAPGCGPVNSGTDTLVAGDLGLRRSWGLSPAQCHAVPDFLQGSPELAGKWGRKDSRGPWGEAGVGERQLRAGPALAHLTPGAWASSQGTRRGRTPGRHTFLVNWGPNK